MPVSIAGRGSEVALLEAGGGTRLVPLCELSAKFGLSQRLIDYARKLGARPDISAALRAAAELAAREDGVLLRGTEGFEGLLTAEGALQAKIGDWRSPGAAVEEVSEALSELSRIGAPPPYVLFVSPRRYASLVAVHERTGIMELTRLKSLVGEVVRVRQMPDDRALLVSANSHVVEVVVGADAVVDYVGPEDGNHVFRAWETLALSLKRPEGIAVLIQE